MPSPTPLANRRILVIDDNAAIHQDFRKVLGTQAEHSAQAALDVLEANLFGDAVVAAARPNFEVDSAHQGQEGVAMAHQALAEGRPYFMAFVDMRMPPGWDGLKTIERLWATDPDVQVVICSAHTDYDWTEVVQRLGHSDKLLVLRKPAEPIEVLQCATALSRKWENDKLVREHVLRLEEVITTRTQGLEAANRQLRHLATHDPLTGLPNRVLLDDRLQQAIAHADRDMRSFALLVCNLDRFKLINESLRDNAEVRTLLQRECSRAQKLSHPNIIRVFYFGCDEKTDADFLTMELLRGEPLDHVGDDDARAEGDGEGGAGGPAGGLDAAAGGGGAGQQRFGFMGEGRARRGQRVLMTVPLEQLDPEVGFEGLDRAAERGLGEQQFRGGPAEVQMVRHREEVTELAQVELGAQVEVPGLPGHA